MNISTRARLAKWRAKGSISIKMNVNEAKGDARSGTDGVAMNILYCGDQGIAQGVLVSILSILKHNARPLHFYIATIEYDGVRAFTDETVEFLDRLVKGEVELEKRENFVKKIDATKVFVENLPEKNMGSYFTPCSMLRLYMDKMPELKDCEKVLYLDYDVVCRGALDELYDVEMGGAPSDGKDENGKGGGASQSRGASSVPIEAAGALDIYGKHFYHYHGLFRQDYMNSGVMLFNLPLCRERGVFEKAVKLCQKRWMMLADQAALNKAIEARKILPRKFNEQGERPRKDTVLHHFSNNFKFWPIFHVQKVKPFEVEKIHKTLKIFEYDDILELYSKLKGEL